MGSFATKRTSAQSIEVSQSSSSECSSARTSDLIQEHIYLVKLQVMKFLGQHSLPIHLKPDLISAGCIGLIEASRSFDPKRGSFKRFASFRIRGAILDCLCSCSGLSRRAYRSIRGLSGAFSRETDPLELMKDCGSARTKLAHLMEFASSGALSFKLSWLQDKTCQENPKESNNPEHLVIEREKACRLSRLVDKLPDNLKFVISEHYYRGKSITQIALSSGEKSKSGVSKLHRRALSQLRSMLMEEQEEF